MRAALQGGSPRSAVAAGLVFAAWCLVLLGVARLPGRGWDFRVFYTAASLPFSDLYQLHQQGLFQRQLMQPWGDWAPSLFARPPFYALLLKPLAALSFPTALHVWLLVLCAVTLACAHLLASLYGGGWRVFLALFGFYPVSLALRLGQDVPLVLAALLLALRFRRRGSMWPAAICLALAFQKFHLLFLVPVALGLHRERALLVRFGACLAALALASVALVGPSGVRQYIELMQSDLMDTWFYDAWNLRATLWRLGGDRVVLWACMAALAAWFVWIQSRLDLETAFWLSVAFGLVITWHSYPYDYLLALPLLHVLWTRHGLVSAPLLLLGSLWPHFFLREAMSWAVAPVLILLSLELWCRSRGRAIPSEQVR